MRGAVNEVSCMWLSKLKSHFASSPLAAWTVRARKNRIAAYDN